MNLMSPEEIMKLQEKYDHKINEIFEKKEIEINNLELTYKENYLDIHLQNVLLENKVEEFQKEISILVRDKNENEVIINTLEEKFDLFNKSLEIQLHESHAKNEGDRIELTRKHAEDIKNFKLELKLALLAIETDYFKDIDQKKLSLNKLEARIDKYVVDLNICNLENKFLTNQISKLEEQLSKELVIIEQLNKKLNLKEKEISCIKSQYFIMTKTQKQQKLEWSKIKLVYKDRIEMLANQVLMKEKQITDMDLKVSDQNAITQKLQSTIDDLNIIISKQNEEMQKAVKQHELKMASLTEDFQLTKKEIENENIKKLQSLEKFIREQKLDFEKKSSNDEKKLNDSIEKEKKKYKELLDRFNSIQKQHFKEKQKMISDIENTNKSSDLSMKKLQEENNSKSNELSKLTKEHKVKMLENANKLKLLADTSQDRISALEQNYLIKAADFNKKIICLENEIDILTKNHENLKLDHLNEIILLKKKFETEKTQLIDHQHCLEDKLNEKIIKKFEEVAFIRKCDIEKYKTRLANMNAFYNGKFKDLKKVLMEYQKKIIYLKTDHKSILNDYHIFTNDSKSNLLEIITTVKKLNLKIVELESKRRLREKEVELLNEDIINQKSIFESRIANSMPITVLERYESIIASLKSQILLLKEQIVSLQKQMSFIEINKTQPR